MSKDQLESKPERMVIQTTDGVEWVGDVEVKPGVVRVHTFGYFGIDLLFRAESIREICKRLLELIDEQG